MQDRPSPNRVWKDKNVVVTGGCGFIGSNLVQHILKCEPKKVTIFDDLSRPWESWSTLESGAVIRIIDLSSRASYMEMYDADIMIHLAAYVGGIGAYIENPCDVLDINLMIDRNVFRNLNPKTHVIYASSGHVYSGNEPDKNGVYRESQNLSIPNLSYGFEKLVGEQILKYANESGRRLGKTGIMRLVGVYGPNMNFMGDASLIPALISRAINYPESHYEVKTTGEETRTYIHVSDVISFFEEFLLSGVQFGTYNVSSQEVVSIREIAEMIKEISKKDMSIKFGELKALIDEQVCSNYDARCISYLCWPFKNFFEGLSEAYKDIEERTNATNKI